MNIIEKRIKIINEAEEDSNKILDIIEKEMKYWQTWLQREKLESELSKKLKTLKMEIEKRVKKLRKEEKK